MATFYYTPKDNQDNTWNLSNIDTTPGYILQVYRQKTTSKWAAECNSRNFAINTSQYNKHPGVFNLDLPNGDYRMIYRGGASHNASGSVTSLWRWNKDYEDGSKYQGQSGWDGRVVFKNHWMAFQCSYGVCPGYNNQGYDTYEQAEQDNIGKFFDFTIDDGLGLDIWYDDWHASDNVGTITYEIVELNAHSIEFIGTFTHENKPESIPVEYGYTYTIITSYEEGGGEEPSEPTGIICKIKSNLHYTKYKTNNIDINKFHCISCCNSIKHTSLQINNEFSNVNYNICTSDSLFTQVLYDLILSKFPLYNDLTGVVADIDTKQLIPDAEIKLMKQNTSIYETISNGFGGFNFKDILYGKYNAYVSHPDYFPSDNNILTLKDGQLQRVVLYLKHYSSHSTIYFYILDKDTREHIIPNQLLYDNKNVPYTINNNLYTIDFTEHDLSLGKYLKIIKTGYSQYLNIIDRFGDYGNILLNKISSKHSEIPYLDDEANIHDLDIDISNIVFVDSKLGNLKETGDGTELNPYININSIFADQKIKDFITKQEYVKVAITGDIDYTVIGNGDNFNYNNLLILSFDSNSQFNFLATLQSDSSATMFKNLKNVRFNYMNLKFDVNNIITESGYQFNALINLFDNCSGIFNGCSISSDLYNYIEGTGTNDHSIIDYKIFKNSTIDLIRCEFNIKLHAESKEQDGGDCSAAYSQGFIGYRSVVKAAELHGSIDCTATEKDIDYSLSSSTGYSIAQSYGFYSGSVKLRDSIITTKAVATSENLTEQGVGSFIHCIISDTNDYNLYGINKFSDPASENRVQSHWYTSYNFDYKI